MKKSYLNTKKAYLFIALLMALTSCSDILNKSSLTEISDKDIWSDPQLVETFVNARYNQVSQGWTESWESSVVDETQLTWDRGCNPINLGYVNSSDLGRSNGAWWGWDNRSWSTVWTNIANCNIFFENIGSVPFTVESQRTRYKGEVRFIRCLMYFDLMRRWGAMPIITRSFTIDDRDVILAQKRNSYEECVNFLTAQLDSAAKELPAKYSGNDNGRATNVAALALKSRVLLYAASDLMNVGVKNELIGYTSPKSNRWRLAADAASACIDLAVSNGYSLYNKYSDATENYKQMWFDTSNPEVLFAREGTTSANNEALPCIDQYNFPNGYGGWGGNCPIQEFVDAFEMKDGTKFDWTNKEEAANPYANRDPRLHASVLCNGDEFASRNLETFINEGEKSGGKDSKFGNDSWNTSLTGYNMRKFLNPAYVGNSWNMPYRRDWIWLRLGEQYLNLAEALYECNDEDGARNALNVIRKRAGMPDVTDTGIALLERIRNERRVELCFEEHRYFDVRRWKLGDEYLNKTVHGIKIIKKSDGSYTYDPTVVVQERKFIERMYWLPLPQAELDKNPNLIQNPGYSSGDK